MKYIGKKITRLINKIFNGIETRKYIGKHKNIKNC